MDDLLYIDANVYLRFFDSNSTEYKKLLTSILEVKDKIFVTSQIVDEVLRKKVGVFLSSFNNYASQLHTPNVHLPEHLQAGKDKDLTAWNQEKVKVDESIKKLKQELETITSNLIDVILEDKDDVSIVLQKIFATAKAETEDQFSRAKRRKARGNPPGKKDDPIGDQLSWEQLLDEIKPVKNLWIITNDGDYVIDYKKKYYLNALLLKELKVMNVGVNIFCFKTLAEALKHFNSITNTKIATLPPQESLETIIEEEQRSNELQEIFTNQISGSNLAGSNQFPNPKAGIFDKISLFNTDPYLQKIFSPHKYLDEVSFKDSTKAFQDKTTCPKCGSSKITPPKNLKTNPTYRCQICGRNFN